MGFRSSGLDDKAILRYEGESAQRSQYGSVFFVTVGISLAFVLAGVFYTEPFSAALAGIVGGITSGLGWVFLLITTFFLVFVFYLAFSRYGSLKLGKPDEKPEFGLFAWFCMLFQAGMGIGWCSGGCRSRSHATQTRRSG